MTLKSKSKVCRLNKKRRMEKGYAKLTLKSKSKLGRLHKKSRMEVGCALMTLKGKKEQNGAGMRNNDPKE